MADKKSSVEKMMTQEASGVLPKKTTEEVCELLLGNGINGYDKKLITNTINEMYETAKMLQDLRPVPKVTVFGSARTQPDHPDYQLCKDFCKQMADIGYMTITGAGPGIMAAAPEGAGGDKSIGVSIDLPFEDGVNKFVADSDHLITYRYFFCRKLTFIREADAIALCPGGFGTMDEAFEALCLLHTGRTMPVPLVLLDHEGSDYWEKWMDYIKDGLLANGMISERDLYIFRRFHHADEAVDYINNFYRRYHSLRYIGDKVVIRLNTPVPDRLLNELREEYADFLDGDGIEKHHGPLPEEADEPDLAHLPRLVITGDKKQPVSLYNLIRDLNRELSSSSASRQKIAEEQNPRPTRIKHQPNE